MNNEEIISGVAKLCKRGLPLEQTMLKVMIMKCIQTALIIVGG